MSYSVAILAWGQTGAGKSALGNAWIQKKDVFQTSEYSESCTKNLQIEQNVIDGIIRYYIDTAGLDSTDGNDQLNNANLVRSLNALNVGINAFFLVISIHEPRITQTIKNMIIALNNFFDDSKCWKQAGIIFTKYNKNDDEINKKINAARIYQENIINFIKSLPKCADIEIPLPYFFVNSIKWETDEMTQREIQKIFDFANKFAPNVHKFQYAALSVKSSFDPRKVQKHIDKLITPGQKSINTFAYGKNTEFTLDDKGKVVIPIKVTYSFLEEYRLNWNSVEIVENSTKQIEAKYDFERMIVYPVLENQYIETYIYHRIRQYWYTFWDIRRKTTRCTRKLKLELSGGFVFKENNNSVIVFESPDIDQILSIDPSCRDYEKRVRTPIPTFFEVTMT